MKPGDNTEHIFCVHFLVPLFWGQLVLMLIHCVVSDSGDPLDCSPPGSSVHGDFQARILAWVAILFSRASSNPGIEPVSPTSPA